VFACPVCGAPVKDGAISCRACGADAETGWKEDAEDVDPDLETSLDDERYDEFLQEDEALGGGTIETKPESNTGCLLTLLFVLAVGALLGWLVSGSRGSRSGNVPPAPTRFP
jgi:hypothetical protein